MGVSTCFWTRSVLDWIGVDRVLGDVWMDSSEGVEGRMGESIAVMFGRRKNSSDGMDERMEGSAAVMV